MFVFIPRSKFRIPHSILLSCLLSFLYLWHFLILFFFMTLTFWPVLVIFAKWLSIWVCLIFSQDQTEVVKEKDITEVVCPSQCFVWRGVEVTGWWCVLLVILTCDHWVQGILLGFSTVKLLFSSLIITNYFETMQISCFCLNFNSLILAFTSGSVLHQYYPFILMVNFWKLKYSWFINTILC